MKTSRIALTITLILALLTFAGSAMSQIKLTENETQKLYITVNTVGTAQTLNHKNVFNGTGAALPKLEPGPAKVEAAAESSSAPALICLTGDAPKRFPLTKRTVTLGRGPHCDLQVVTHFVSREHARITLTDGKPLIEDLGSRNGLFVNSVRVDRRTLQHGDLVTIGESQFRFVESMAH